MATIMTVGGSEGTRRCDATCHKATSRKCACVCGGRYHGTASSAVAAHMCAEDLRLGVHGAPLQAAARELGAELAVAGTNSLAAKLMSASIVVDTSAGTIAPPVRRRRA